MKFTDYILSLRTYLQNQSHATAAMRRENKAKENVSVVMRGQEKVAGQAHGREAVESDLSGGAVGAGWFT